jgi:transglutaminase-like putative cysteine protease
MTKLIKPLLFMLVASWVLLPLTARADDPYRALIDEIGTDGIYKDANLAIVFDSTFTDVEASGLSHVTNHKLIKVLSWDGARQMTALRLDFDPVTMVFEPLAAIIHRADGTLEKLDANTALDLPQPQSMIYWGPRMRVLGLPRLNVGDAVEFKTYRKGFQIAYLDAGPSPDEDRYVPPQRGEFYDVIVFAENDPVREKVYIMTISKDKPAQYQNYNDEVFSKLDFAGDKLVYTFWKKSVPAIKHEPRQPDATDFAPKIVLATLKDWPARSRWFFAVNDTMFDANDDVKRTAQNAVRGLKTEDEQIAACLHWAAQNIRYSGINMGKGEGYTLHSGIMTLNDRAGVCKDIASMSITLLRSIGFTVYPAMTMAGARVEMVPADQFNHCVVAVKRKDGSYTMIDPTWTPYAMDIWSPAEANQNYVIGSPEGETRMEIRYYKPEENQTHIDLKGKLSENGDLEGIFTLQGTGFGDTRLRRGVAYMALEKLDNWFSDWLAKLSPDAEYLGYTCTDIKDLTKPTRLDIRFKVKGYALKAGDQLQFSPAAAKFAQAYPRGFDLVNDLKGDERANPLFLYNTRQVVITETIDLPVGYALKNTPDTKDEGGKWATFHAEASQSGKTYNSKLEYKVFDRVIEPKYNDEVKGAYDGIKDFAGKTWLLRKGTQS